MSSVCGCGVKLTSICLESDVLQGLADLQNPDFEAPGLPESFLDVDIEGVASARDAFQLSMSVLEEGIREMVRALPLLPVACSRLVLCSSALRTGFCLRVTCRILVVRLRGCSRRNSGSRHRRSSRRHRSRHPSTQGKSRSVWLARIRTAAF